MFTVDLVPICNYFMSLRLTSNLANKSMTDVKKGYKYCISSISFP